MKPPLTIERLEPFVIEAMERFSLGGDWRDYAAIVVANVSDPSAVRHNERLTALYHRVLSHEYKDYTRRDLEAILPEDWPFVAVEIWTDQSCRLAQSYFAGKRWHHPDPLPLLPMADCPSPHCHCSYRPLSASEIRRRG